MGSQALSYVEKALWQLSRKLWKQQQIVWLPIVCPHCSSVISQKTASKHLICLGCGREFALTEVSQDE